MDYKKHIPRASRNEIPAIIEHAVHNYSDFKQKVAYYESLQGVDVGTVLCCIDDDGEVMPVTYDWGTEKLIPWLWLVVDKEPASGACIVSQIMPNNKLTEPEPLIMSTDDLDFYFKINKAYIDYQLLHPNADPFEFYNQELRKISELRKQLEAQRIKLSTNDAKCMKQIQSLFIVGGSVYVHKDYDTLVAQKCTITSIHTYTDRFGNLKGRINVVEPNGYPMSFEWDELRRRSPVARLYINEPPTYTTQ